MPWITYPYDKQSLDSMANKYHLDGIPYLTVLNKDGTPAIDDAYT